MAANCKSKTLKTLSLADRVEVLKRIDSKESQVSVAKHFGVHPSQICRIVKQRQQVMVDWQSKDFIRAYLESIGCESYENFYALSNQVYDRRPTTSQKTMLDYFRHA